MIMAGVAAFSNYKGTFDFHNIGDLYPGSLPYTSMRLTVSLMGALCAPMAYVTLKSSGQSAFAAILASVMIVFVYSRTLAILITGVDNALATNNRLLGQDAPLMFFSAATFMFWALFNKQSASPFTFAWWLWLLATGISMTGAMGVKLAGAASVLTIGMFTLLTLSSLAMDASVSGTTWLKHFAARTIALVVIPVFLYMAIFQFHFDHQLNQPADPSSPQADHDLNLLSKSFRQTLLSKNIPVGSEVDWSDVVYGSVVQLQNEGSSGVYLHSFHGTIPDKSKQQQLGGYQHSDLNTHWIVIRADMEEDDKEEIPSRLQYLKDGDIFRLRHVPTRMCLHSDNTRSYSDKKEAALFEVTAYGAQGYDGDENDWWIVETVDPITNTYIPEGENVRIKALETAFRLRHMKLGCYLFDTSTHLPEPWGQGRYEIACRPGVKIRPRSVWRFTMNRHDYLPYDTPVAAYPQLSFWQKFLEIHQLMWSHVPVDQSFHPAAVHPIRWPLGQAVVHTWTGYLRQITLIANPVVWGLSLIGLLSYAGLKVLFILREKRGYVERGLIGELKRFHVNNANTYFAGWALHYLPFFMVRRTLLMHHYFPALYFSILITSSMVAGVSGFLPRKARFGLFISLIFAILSTFAQISPLTYGSSMMLEQCESISQWANDINCAPFPKASNRPLQFSELRMKQRAKKLLHKQHEGSKTVAAQIPEASNSPEDISSDYDYHNLPEGKQPTVARPEPRKRSPVLPLNLPPPDYPLPMQHLIMVGPQLPPQMRDIDVDYV
ncbi:hypothetical protein BGX27_000937 [Mortierella sp. AM989]|nr:hypothetical protein BGX27_000937 [Mortierella sp. AM989]